jgi:hypothetical protein
MGVAANILNKQSRTADKGWPSSLGLGRGLTTPPRKKKHVTKCYKGPRNWTDTLERPKARKMDMRFVTWNVRSLYRSGSLKTVSGELVKYKLHFMGVQEVRWDKGGTEPAGN